MISTLFTLSLCSVVIVESFRGSSSLVRKVTVDKNSIMQMSNKEYSKIMVGFVSLLSASSISLSPVVAANYGGFGSTYSEVIDPKSAILNDETSKSDEVKAGVEALNKFLQTVSDFKSALVCTTSVRNYTVYLQL